MAMTSLSSNFSTSTLARCASIAMSGTTPVSSHVELSIGGLALPIDIHILKLLSIATTPPGFAPPLVASPTTVARADACIRLEKLSAAENVFLLVKI